MFEELAASRRLIWLLIRRDISVRYRQSALGYLWAVIPQIVTVGAFAMLNGWRVVPMGKTAIRTLSTRRGALAFGSFLRGAWPPARRACPRPARW